MVQKIQSRQIAGRLLALKLLSYVDRADVLVLGLPPGGVPVAQEIASTLRLPLDVLVVRKLAAPGIEGVAMGAVAHGEIEIVDPDAVEEFNVSDTELAAILNAERGELKRKEAAYRSSRPAFDLRDRGVVLVDDGIETGATMRAAIETVRRLGATRVIVAAGVATLSVSLELRAEADEAIYVLRPREFRATASFYEDFPELRDEDVRSLLREAWKSDTPNAA
ncbi:MAG TPA: phosphoribosyltransferase family protein [Verrucomicrobiae bacterium]|nr:phosphoribosyltransferase family protein [Verrucomicrobiae bacterium]